MNTIIKHCFRKWSSIAMLDVGSENQAMLDAIELAQKVARALERAEARGLHAADIARECDVTAQAVTGWKKTGRVAKKHLPIIARHADVPVEWFLTTGDTALKSHGADSADLNSLRTSVPAELLPAVDILIRAFEHGAPVSALLAGVQGLAAALAPTRQAQGLKQPTSVAKADSAQPLNIDDLARITDPAVQRTVVEAKGRALEQQHRGQAETEPAPAPAAPSRRKRSPQRS